jgi:hypothetical protein
MADIGTWTNFVNLDLCLHWNLENYFPGLITEVNSVINVHPKTGLPLPDAPQMKDYILGIQTSMLKREIEDLPVLGCGVFIRTIAEEGEQAWAEVVFPFTIDIYLGGTDASKLTVQAKKLATALDQFIERYGNSILPGYRTPEAADLEVSYTLEKRGDEFAQLVSVTGVFESAE